MQTGLYCTVQLDARDKLAKLRVKKLRPARKLRPIMRESHPNGPGGTVPCAGRAGAPNVVKHEKINCQSATDKKKNLGAENAKKVSS